MYVRVATTSDDNSAINILEIEGLGSTRSEGLLSR